MTWHYAIIRAKDGGCRIAEVYEREGRVSFWTTDPTAPYGDNLDELRADVHRMKDALERPVLDEADLEAAVRATG